ncbi:hypothetical protein UlMin_016806 [Ulmus minor]
MEAREDLNTILPFLPLVLRSSSLFWPSQVVESLKIMAKGPEISRVSSGEVLFLAISDLRDSLSLSTQDLASFAPQGYTLFFDELISREESREFFEDVVPALANLILQFPSLLELHYQNADRLRNDIGKNTGIRLLGSQEAGIVLLSQELIGALLGCSLFCLFPLTSRDAKNLPTINFDRLFSSLYESYNQKQENKIKCLTHYFKRICAHMPVGFVSFERKVLPLEHHAGCISYPDANFWSNSGIPLCHFEVQSSGFIEDHSSEALEVDFANKYLGGGALHRGCVQEEIRFMINPELIAGMLFLPSMANNESIEIVGAERFSEYKGYASSFCFSGDYVDKKEVDSLGRRKTRIIAIDALCSPGMRQYKAKYVLREVNKAFCGFIDETKYHHYGSLFSKNGSCGSQLNLDAKDGGQLDLDVKDPNYKDKNNLLANDPSTSIETVMRISRENGRGDNVGIATGNWGCGAFGGDPELKTIIQWLAASQALRPFISYHTFGEHKLRNLDQVSKWILSEKWTVGDLWNMVVEYTWQKLKGEANDVGFFAWLLPMMA